MGTFEVTKVRGKWDPREVVMIKMNVALKQLRISRPSRDAGQALYDWERMRKELPCKIAGKQQGLKWEEKGSKQLHDKNWRGEGL